MKKITIICAAFLLSCPLPAAAGMQILNRKSRTQLERENLQLRQLIARDYRVVSTLETASETCYREFRKRNVFTHDIAYPKGLTLNVQD